MSKQVDEILTSLKDRPEEWKVIGTLLVSNRYRICMYGFSPTHTKVCAYTDEWEEYNSVFLSYQNKWVLERAVSEWMELNNKTK